MFKTETKTNLEIIWDKGLITYREDLIIQEADYQETMKARVHWDYIIKVLTENKTIPNLSTQNLYPAKLFFKNEGEINMFPNKQQQRIYW